MEKAKINAIRKYLSHNGVKYYDVQAELIDHFATAVEKIEKEEPGIRFKEALLRAHRRFGGNEGFWKYLNSAEKSVEKKTYKLIGHTLLQFLKWPYLLVTAAVVTFWHFTLEAFGTEEMFWDLLFSGFMALYLLVFLINYLRLQKVQMFLPRRANTSLGHLFYFSFYLPYLTIRDGSGLPDTLALIYFSLLTLNVVAFARVPDLAIRETKKMYPKISG